MLQRLSTCSMIHALIRFNPNLSARSLVGSHLIGQRAEGLSTLKKITSATTRKVGKSATNSAKLSVAATLAKSVSNELVTVSTKKYADGYVYKGSWHEGEWAGKGKLTSAAGQVWEGEFKEGKIYKGTGVVVFPDGDVYEGNWVEGKMEGKGQWTQANGSYLKGGFKNDTFYEGMGVLVHTDGTVSKGTWEGGTLSGDFVKHNSIVEVSYAAPSKANIPNAQPHSCKEVVNPDGSVLKGEFKAGKIYNGKGVLIVDGHTYEGTWLGGKIQGEVKITYPKDDTYIGEVVMLVHGSPSRNGFGVMKYSNGEVYEGKWGKGKRHGKGKVTNPDGTVLEGEWHEGKIYDGCGKYVTSNGTLYEGTWVEGILTGKRTSPTGRVMEGEFKDNRIYNGSGVLEHPGGAVHEGTWVEGKMEGQGKQTIRDGTVLEGEFRAGKLISSNS